MAIRERYEPLSVLGEGGMGIVLQARDSRMGRVVAIKGPRDPGRVTAEARERLAREARLQSRLTHPNILPVFDAWTDDEGNPWCSMLLVLSDSTDPAGSNGPTLGRELQALRSRSSLEERPLSRLLETLIQVCRAVAYAHGRGVLHRDLKPDNVLLGPSGEALVADWGLAIELQEPASDTHAKEIVGSPPYASPEQLGALGAPRSDERSDVHGLGAILYEMVSGLEFSPGEQGPEGPRLSRRVPRELAGIIRRAVARDPSARFPSVAALRQALEAYLDGGLVEGMSYTLVERASKRFRSHPGSSAAIATAAIFTGMLAYTIWQNGRALERELAESRRNLASSHAGWAAVEDARGHSDETRAYAALAFDTASQVPGGWILPDGPVHPIFMRRSAPTPLAWAASLGDLTSAFRFSSDGSKLVAATTKQCFELALGDTTHPRERALPGTLLALDPHGELMLVYDSATRLSLIARDGTVRRIETGRPISRAAVSPDGRTIVTAHGKDVRVWDASSARCTATLTRHDTDVWLLAIDHRGKRLVSVDRQARMCVWDLGTLRLESTIDPDIHAVLAVDFSPDDRTIAVAGVDARVHLLGLPEGRRIATFGGRLPIQMCVAFSPDGRTVAAGGKDYAVRFWDTASGLEQATLTGHTLWVVSLAFSPDSRLLASGGYDGSVRLWDVRRAKEAQVSAARDWWIADMAFDPDGRRVAALGSEGSLQIWDIASSTATRATTPAPRAVAIALGPAQEVLTAGFEAGRVLVSGRGAGCALACRGRPVRVVFGDFGRTLAVGFEDGWVRIFRLDSSTLTIDIPSAGSAVRTMAFDERGTLLAVGDATGSIRLHDVRSGATVAQLAGHSMAISALGFRPDGRALLSGDALGGLRYWTAPDWRGSELPGHTAPISGVAIRGRGDLGVSAAGEAVYVRRLPSGEKITRLLITTGDVTRAGFSPDGMTLTMGGRGQLENWDLSALDDPSERVTRTLGGSFFALSGESRRLAPKRPEDAPLPRLPR